MKNLKLKLFLVIFFSVFIISFSNAQKIETKKVARSNSDFTTTPFQDGNQAKGFDIELAEFEKVNDGEFREGDVLVKIPTTFNPEIEAFSIDGDAVVLKMKVYNMLGELVYEGEKNAIWQDENIREGLYIYTLDTQILPNKITKLKGFIRAKK